MEGQKQIIFCIYRDCGNLALFGDYCRDHQFQRAETAEARSAELLRRLEDAQAQQLEQAQQAQRALDQALNEGNGVYRP